MKIPTWRNPCRGPQDTPVKHFLEAVYFLGDLSRLLSLFAPQFSHLYNGGDIPTLPGILGAFSHTESRCCLDMGCSSVRAPSPCPEDST